MNLATEIHHTDFSYHCKDFEGKEWHVFEFYAGASSSKAIVASMGTGTSCFSCQLQRGWKKWGKIEIPRKSEV